MASLGKFVKFLVSEGANPLLKNIDGLNCFELNYRLTFLFSDGVWSEYVTKQTPSEKLKAEILKTYDNEYKIKCLERVGYDCTEVKELLRIQKIRKDLRELYLECHRTGLNIGEEIEALRREFSESEEEN